MPVQPRTLSVLALLALVPVALFLLGRGETIVVLSLVSVVIIAASLYYLLSPSQAATAGTEGEPAVEETDSGAAG